MTTEHTISRRTVARGAAWSVPAIATGAAAPAMAASTCAPALSISGGVTYDWGTIQNPAVTTTQTLTAGAETFITGLPAGVTVTQVTYDYWFQQRTTGQTSPGPGIFWVGNPASNRSSTCDSSAGTCSGMSYSTGNNGWQPVTSLGRNTAIQHGTQTLTSWNLHFTWTNAANSGIYTAIPGTSCQKFDTGPSGRFAVVYSNITGLTACSSPQGALSYVQNVKATLSNGSVLTYSLTSTDASNVCK